MKYLKLPPPRLCMFPFMWAKSTRKLTGSPKPTHSSLSPLGIRRLPPSWCSGSIAFDKMMIPLLFAGPAHEKPKGFQGEAVA